MRKKLEAIVFRLRSAVRRNPVEVVESVFFCLMAFIYYELGYDSLKDMLIYFPVLFLTTYSLNGLTFGRKIRPLYYLSFFCFIPFIGWNLAVWAPAYWVSLVVVQLVYLIKNWERDNDAFVRTGLRYFKALLSAGLLASIAYLLAISIYYSVRYIFEFGEYSETAFLVESSYVIFIWGMPLLFLMFNEEKEESSQRNRLFEVLLNYVLSPALLIYAVILYLYFIKIAFLWSLPNGAVAYIVVSFVSIIFILKGCQVFLEKRYYDWFYKRASVAVLPALIMYWIGTYYRINQYGYTELRVYLVVVGIILTGLAILFFTKRWGRYLYAACLALVLLSVVTYIPGITAKDIEKFSQQGRDNTSVEESPYVKYAAYVSIENKYPVNIAAYDTLIPILSYESSTCLLSVTRQDTFYLYKNGDILYQEDLASFWNRQLSRVNLAPDDSIPETVYPELLQFDMDSAKVIFETIGLRWEEPDSTYRISYIVPAYYLKKK